MDVTNLIRNLQSQINSTSLDQQMISKAIKLLELGAVEQVSSFVALPAASSNSGRLFYVLYDGLYLSNGVYWFPITQTRLGITWAWGCGQSGELGDCTVTTRSSPVSVVGAFTNWCQVSAGRGWSMGLRCTGSLWSWGNNHTIGALGDNSVTNKSSPVSVVGGFSDWRQVSAAGSGGYHTLATRSNGSLWAWGLGGSGQLGNNSSANRSSPVSVAGGPLGTNITNWCQASAGGSHSVGITTSSCAYAWGAANYGQLGSNQTICRSSPVVVVGDINSWCQVSAGGFHNMGLTSAGVLWGWGSNNSGRMGDGTATNRSSPVSVVGGFTDWCQVSAGSAHTLATRTNGTAWAWGSGLCGVLGLNTNPFNAYSSPRSVVGGFTDWCQVSAGQCHSLGVRQNGTTWAWGSNVSWGQLGDNTVTNRSSPVSVVGGFTNWCQVAAGTCHSLGIRSSST